ncbi:MAG: hypothetical protein AAFW67_12155 [Cyanobacteria bacterium J06638_38]
MVRVKVADVIAHNPTLQQRIINALKVTTIEAFLEAIAHPSANVVRAGIEGYQELN